MNEKERNERTPNRTDAKPCLSDVYKKSTRAKLQKDATFSGRSMVEMLGVLAIIGVLSVGAISGYSKAMMKYKLNKQAEQINQLMTALVQYKSAFADAQLNVSLVPLFIKLNAIPSEMINPDGYTIQDVFGLNIKIMRQSNLYKEEYLYFYFSFTNYLDQNHSICYNVLENFKGYASELHSLGVNSTTSTGTNQQQWYYGDYATNQSQRKIHTLDLQSMQTLCSLCDKNLCTISAVFPLQ